MKEETWRCDKCGKEMSGDRWNIGLQLSSGWGVDSVVIELCSVCGWKAAKMLGFCYDTGKILSIGRKEEVTSADLHQSLPDLATNGFQGGVRVYTAQRKPGVPIASAMCFEEES